MAADHATSIDSNALIAVSAEPSAGSASGPMFGISSERNAPSVDDPGREQQRRPRAGDDRLLQRVA